MTFGFIFIRALPKSQAFRAAVARRIDLTLRVLLELAHGLVVDGLKMRVKASFANYF
jgi:hypothetical protein